jgi:hypothetical protein
MPVKSTNLHPGVEVRVPYARGVNLFRVMKGRRIKQEQEQIERASPDMTKQAAVIVLSSLDQLSSNAARGRDAELMEKSRAAVGVREPLRALNVVGKAREQSSPCIKSLQAGEESRRGARFLLEIRSLPSIHRSFISLNASRPQSKLWPENLESAGSVADCEQLN